MSVGVQVTKEEYGRIGQVELGRQLVEKLREAGGNPYLIPVGGSSGVGSWGYLEAWREILEQAGDQPFTDIVMVSGRSFGDSAAVSSAQGITLFSRERRVCLQACGSGGTTAGLALGNYLSGATAKIHAFAVCDTPGR